MWLQHGLEAFLAVVDGGSVSAAAAARFTTQPTLSRQIASLERETGTKLFRRTTSGMVLTAAGERLEPMARDLVKRGRRAAQVLAALGSERQSFSVACPETTGNYFVANFVAEGGAVTDIQPSAPAEVYGRLRLGADLAINTAAPPQGLRGVEIAQLEVKCMAPAAHPLAGRRTVELRDVTKEPFFMPGAGSAVERIVTQAAGSAGITLELGTLTSNGTLAQARSAAGNGVALVVENPFFGLEPIPLRHEGAPLIVRFYAAWERSHYASDELAQLASELGVFMQRRIEEQGLSPTAVG